MHRRFRTARGTASATAPATILRIAAVAAVLLATACASSGGDRPAGPQRIAPPGTSLEGLPFAPAVRAGDLVFLSGQIGNLPGTRELVPGGIAAETRQTLENIRTLLRAADLDVDDVVKCTVFLVDIRDYDAMNQVYARFFGSRPPARSTMAGSGLALGARVEIECIGWAGG